MARVIPSPQNMAQGDMRAQAALSTEGGSASSARQKTLDLSRLTNGKNDSIGVKLTVPQEHQLFFRKAADFGVQMEYDANLNVYHVTGNAEDVARFLADIRMEYSTAMISYSIIDIEVTDSQQQTLFQKLAVQHNRPSSQTDTIFFTPSSGDGGVSAVVRRIQTQETTGEAQNPQSSLGQEVSDALQPSLLLYDDEEADSGEKSQDNTAFTTTATINYLLQPAETIGDAGRTNDDARDGDAESDADGDGTLLEPPVVVVEPPVSLPPSGPAPSQTALSAAIDDVLPGSGGDDAFSAADVALWHSTDSITGGAGDDSLTIDAGTVNLTLGTGNYENISSVESVVFSQDAPHALTIVDSYFTAGAGVQGNMLKVDMSASTTTNTTIDGSGVLAAHALDLTTAAGNDTISGGAGDDSIVSGGGIDSIAAGAGDDSITIADWMNPTLDGVSPASLELWLDASDSGTLTRDDQAVTQWADKSSNGFDASAFVYEAPLLGPTTVNGRAALSFSSDVFQTAALTLNGVSSFVVLKEAPNAAGDRVFLELSASTLANDGYWMNTGNATVGSGSRVNGATNDVFVPTSADSVWDTGAAMLAEVHVDAAGPVTLYANGAVDAQNPTANTGAIGSDILYIGARPFGGLDYTGAIAEIIIFDDIISDADRYSVQRYLSNKYGIEMDSAVTDTNDTIDGGAGVDTLAIESGVFSLNPGGLSSFNSIEIFNLAGNNAAHELIFTDAYYNTNGGVENDVVTVNVTGNATGVYISGNELSAPHSIKVLASDGTDTVLGGAGNDEVSYEAFSAGVNVNLVASSRLVGIELLTGSGQGDTLTGGMGGHTLAGGAGNDKIYGNIDTAFLPTSVAAGDMQLWLDADDAASMSEVGGAVSQWNDKSGNANHAVAAGGFQPLNNVTTLNGRTTLAFSNDMLVTPNLALEQGLSVYVVMVEAADAGSVRMVLELSTNAFANDGFWMVTGQGVGGAGARIRGDRANEFLQTSTDSLWDTGDAVLAEINASRSGPLSILKDGVVDAQSLVATDDISTDQLYIGARAGNAIPFTGSIGEIIVFDRSLQDEERQQIESYLGEKWGLNIADDDSLSGGAGNDVIYGGIGNDTLDGGADNDTLAGGNGNDLLTGGTGDDVFVFVQKLSGHADNITDFGTGADTIVLSDAAFVFASGEGAKSAVALTDDTDIYDVAGFAGGNFAGGAGATFLYDTTDGQVWYDTDAAGGGGVAVLIATIDNFATYTYDAADFVGMA